MKSFLTFSALLSLLLFSVCLFAQSVAPAVAPAVPALPPAVSDSDFLQLLIKSLGGLKGAGILGGIGIFIKLFLQFLSTPICGAVFPKLSSAMKLIVVLALTMIAGVVGLMSQGLSLSAALMHSATLSAFMVLANQMYKHWIAKDDGDVPPAQAPQA